MTYRLGVDIGGTFTDFALFDESGSEIAVLKRLTTPADPSIAVIEGTAALLRREDVPMAQVETIAHGTTLVTNAVIERRGAKTGMLVTTGFRDILDMGFEQRYDLFDLRLTWPDPLVPRRLRREVRERVGHDGQVIAALDLESTRAAVRGLVESAGVEALAICFLHSYVNPVHEDAAGELVRAEFPDLHVSRSTEVFGNMREYERWTTATMNAYTQPMFARYIERLERGLADLGFGGRLLVMTSSGASIVPETARRFPVRALESGPAAGALMSAHHGRKLGFPDLLSFDMGGTTAKGALVRGFTALKQYDLEVGRVHEFKSGSGLPVKLPVIDMIEIGSGGGSLARVDERGLIRVGPKSAGADPGPACYAKGGTRPTLTDADVVLGYLDPEFFLGGEMRLDADAARAAIEEHVARPAGLDPIRAAWGVHEIANEDVARAFRIHASERGFDYRRSSMVAFGGSGPVHALAVARKLRIPRVIFPIGAGVMSALGLLVSPLGFEVSRSRRILLAGLDARIRAGVPRVRWAWSRIAAARQLRPVEATPHAQARLHEGPRRARPGPAFRAFLHARNALQRDCELPRHPEHPGRPRSRDRGRNATLRGAARTPARDVWTRIDPFRVPLRRGEYVRRRAAGQGLQLREDGLESLPPRLGPAGRGRVHGGDRLHRHPLVRPALRSGHSMASDGLVGTRPFALFGHDVLCREGKELRVQSAVAREAGSPYRGLFPAQGSPHKPWHDEPRG